MALHPTSGRRGSSLASPKRWTEPLPGTWSMRRHERSSAVGAGPRPRGCLFNSHRDTARIGRGACRERRRFQGPESLSLATLISPHLSIVGSVTAFWRFRAVSHDGLDV